MKGDGGSFAEGGERIFVLTAAEFLVTWPAVLSTAVDPEILTPTLVAAVLDPDGDSVSEV